MRPEQPLRLGIDVGGTHLRVGVVQGMTLLTEQRVRADLARHCDPHDAGQAEAYLLEQLRAAIDSVPERAEIGGIGLSIAGFVDVASGSLLSSPNIPGVRDLALGPRLAEELALPVVLENDAMAAAWGEFVLHPEHPRDLIYLGLGTGVGGGVVLNGRPWRGSHGYAMEIGHLLYEAEGRLCGCGNQGCLERYASASGLGLNYQELSGETLEAAEIAERAQAGDPAARNAFAYSARALAVGLAHMLKVLDVPDVVIGGGMSAGWQWLASAFHERLEQELIPVLRGRIRVRLSASGDSAGMIGAALLAAKA